MIIAIWIIILALSLILIIAGKYIEGPPLQIGGFAFLFIMGLTLMLGGVQYTSGSNSITTYTYNGTNITQTNETITNLYTSYSTEIIQGITINHTVGFFICVLSVFGFISVMMNLDKDPFAKKPRNKQVYDYEE